MIGKSGSEAYRTIREETGLRRFVNGAVADVIVNYGLSGQRLDSFFREHRAARNIPVINKNIGVSKYTAVQRVNKAGLLVPESKLSLSVADKKTDWIEKRFNSSRGYGIRMAGGRERMGDKYYQRYVKDRVYELRIAAFLWVPTEEWGIYKRYGDKSKIAWNFHQGGHFTGVHDRSALVFRQAVEMSKKALEVLHMGFGAVDFLVDTARRVYFIEVNAAPGFTEFSGSTYIRAFKKIPDTPLRKLRDIAIL
jgi:glutathione synthase/RimK-type ligase-like ATP-grasp enzyme